MEVHAMMKHTRTWWALALPALLLAGLTWGDVAQAQKDDRFDGPGGMSAPAEPREESKDDRWKDGGDRKGKSSRMHRAHGRHGRMGAMRGRGRDVMAQLDLNDRQKEQIQTIKDAQQRRMIPIRASLEEAGLDLRDLMRADNPNQGRIDAAIDRLADLRADAHKERVKSMLQIRDVLTDEQKKKLKDARGGRGWMRGMGMDMDGDDDGRGRGAGSRGATRSGGSSTAS
jgi:Spy/CpxP family protein refolding chaperone